MFYIPTSYWKVALVQSMQSDVAFSKASQTCASVPLQLCDALDTNSVAGWMFSMYRTVHALCIFKHYLCHINCWHRGENFSAWQVTSNLANGYICLYDKFLWGLEKFIKYACVWLGKLLKRSMVNFSFSKRTAGERKKGKGKSVKRKEMNAAFLDSLVLHMITITGRQHHSGTVRITLFVNACPHDADALGERFRDWMDEGQIYFAYGPEAYEANNHPVSPLIPLLSTLSLVAGAKKDLCQRSFFYNWGCQELNPGISI